MLKEPMTTEEFFDKICEILKEKGMMPDILDYALATHSSVPMTTYEYDIRNNLDYGGSEGIYLDFWIEVNANLDDFTWRGADAYAIDENGKRYDWGYSYGTMEAAMKKKNELLKKYPQVAVRDNATRKEKIYTGEATRGWGEKTLSLSLFKTS